MTQTTQAEEQDFRPLPSPRIREAFPGPWERKHPVSGQMLLSVFFDPGDVDRMEVAPLDPDYDYCPMGDDDRACLYRPVDKTWEEVEALAQKAEAGESISAEAFVRIQEGLHPATEQPYDLLQPVQFFEWARQLRPEMLIKHLSEFEPRRLLRVSASLRSAVLRDGDVGEQTVSVTDLRPWTKHDQERFEALEEKRDQQRNEKASDRRTAMAIRTRISSASLDMLEAIEQWRQCIEKGLDVKHEGKKVKVRSVLHSGRVVVSVSLASSSNYDETFMARVSEVEPWTEADESNRLLEKQRELAITILNHASGLALGQLAEAVQILAADLGFDIRKLPGIRSE